MKTLLEKCLCGCVDSKRDEKNGIKVLICSRCGLIRQDAKITPADLFHMYSGEYLNGIYTHSYDQDFATAKKRYAKLKLGSRARKFKGKILDVGCGQGAFLDLCLQNGHDAIGQDLTSVKGPSSLTIYPKSLKEIMFPTDEFNLVTMFDVLEHCPNPVEILEEAFRIVKREGRVVVEIPRFFHKSGNRHWKEIEHLWYFDDSALKSILRQVGFKVGRASHPIQSKTSIVATKPNLKRTKILVPPGIGDSYWSLIKIRDFCEKNELGIPDVYATSPEGGRDRSADFIKRFPFVHFAGYVKVDKKDPVFDEAYRKNGRTIFENVYGCDYFISYNGVMRFDESPETKDVQYLANWFEPMFQTRKEELFGPSFRSGHGKYAIVYFIGHGMYQRWVREFDENEIAKTLTKFARRTNLHLVFVGASWDEDSTGKMVFDMVEARKTNLIGKTDLSECFSLLKSASCVIGYPSGVSIMATRFRTPTLLLWNKSFRESFWRDACPPQSWGKWYQTMNTATATVDRVVDSACSLIGSGGEKPVVKHDRPKKSSHNSRKRVFACVLRSGGCYDPDHVKKLFNMAKRHLSVKYEFVCLSDQKLDFCDYAELEDLKIGKWWSKLEIFRKGLFNGHKTVFMDLDMLLIRDVSKLFETNLPFTMMRAHNEKRFRSSAIMAFEGDFSFLFDEFEKNRENVMGNFRSDQEYIVDACQRHGIDLTDHVQNYVNVKSFKRDCEFGRKLPSGTHIVGFHGVPRPWQVANKVPWVATNYV